MTKRFLRLLPICALLCLSSCTGRSDHWLSLLEQAEEMNRNDVPFTSDSIGKELVRHYDHWWHSPYLRLRAYYMLGSAYRDMGEAPAALHYYNIATEQVDTAHADSATNATLFRVYGQMATIYGNQDMPMEQLFALEKYGKYALKAKDTLNYILGYEHLVSPYYEMDSTEQVLRVTEKARQLYLKYGFQQNAARVYPTAIYVYIQKKDWEKARKHMSIFERESGLFDDDGNIAKGRELYYDAKGKYYLGIHKLDSAEYFYRKLALTHYKYESSDGLLSIYSEKECMDSIFKYSILSKEALLQWATDRQAEAVIQSSAMYRYERNQNLAMINAQKATRFRQLCFAIFIVSLLLFTWLYRLFKRRSQKQSMRLRQLNKNYVSAQKELEQLMEEHRILKDIYNKSEVSDEAKALIEKKQRRIEQLEQQIEQYQIDLNTLTYSEREKLLKETGIVVYFMEKITITPNWKIPRPEKWKQLSDVYT